MANIDFDSEDIENLVSSFSSIITRIEDAKVDNLSSCSYINDQCTETYGDIEKYYNLAIKYLSRNTGPVMSILEEMKLIDEMGEGVYDFTDILILMQMKKKGAKIYKADEDFFKKCGHEVKNGIVIIKGPEGTYKYDIKNRRLTNPDGTWLFVNYYIPEDVDDISKLNTITCLAGQREEDIDTTKDENSFHLDKMGSNAIIVCPSKFGQKAPGIDLGSASYSFMADRVMNSTKFATLFANQKPGCQNIIGGCSSGGGSALKIASQSGDLYDTVFCINYAALIEGGNVKVGSGKGLNGEDNNRLSMSDAMNLNGKNIIFLSSSTDPNAYYEDNKNNTSTDPYSYLYTGIKLLIKYCPDSQIYLSTNRDNWPYRSFSDPNFHLLGNDFWNNYATEKHSGHGSYHGMLRDLINSCVLGYNVYNS